MWRSLWERYLSFWPVWVWATLIAGLIGSLIVGWKIGLPHLEQRRVSDFITQAVEARTAGHFPEAEANLRSALSIKENEVSARVALVQVLIDQGKFADAMREATDTAHQWGGSPEQFVFDSLLRRKNFAGLVVFSLEQSIRQPDRAIWWYKVALNAARVVHVEIRNSDDLPARMRALIKSQNWMLRGETEKASLELSRVAGGQLRVQEGLLIFGQWLTLNRPIEAALALGTFSHRLNPFERTLAEFQLNNVNDPWLALPTLKELIPLAISDARRSRIVVALIEQGTREQAEWVLNTWLADSDKISIEVLGDIWVLGHTYGVEKVGDWEEVFRYRTGKNLPNILGQKLGSTETEERRVAVNLLSGQVPFSREVVMALFVATSPSAN